MDLDPVFIVLLLAVSSSPAQAFNDDRPNIVMIVADDMGWNDVGHHGSEIPTPNIDALGYNGVLLKNHYSQTLCSPSRAALLTGKYPIRLGFQGKPLPAGSPVGLPLSETIMPQYLAQLGYSNHMIGKWHLGHARTEFLPTSRGFDSYFGFWNGFIGHYDGVHAHINDGMKGLDMHRGESGAWAESYGKHITRLLTDEALLVINNRTSRGGMLLVVNHAAPHTGNKGLELLSPPFGLGRRGAHIQDPNRRVYADMVKALDDSVGEIVSALAGKGLLNNSIIVFISDNGAPTDDQLWGLTNYGSNWPLRGQKCSGHEGGIKTIGLAWSPLFNNRSRIYDFPMHITDWVPTFFAAAGGDPTNLKRLDGVSHWDALRTGLGPAPRRVMLAEMDESGMEALIMDKWKLIKNNPPGSEMYFSDWYSGESGRDLLDYNVTEVEESLVGRALGGDSTSGDWEGLRGRMRLEAGCGDGRGGGHGVPCHLDHCLFDLAKDPCESHDLAPEMASTVTEMRARLAAFRAEMVPKPSRTIDPKADPKLHDNYWSTWQDPPKTISGSSHVNADCSFFTFLTFLITVIFL